MNENVEKKRGIRFQPVTTSENVSVNPISRCARGSLFREFRNVEPAKLSVFIREAKHLARDPRVSVLSRRPTTIITRAKLSYPALCFRAT